MIGETKGIKIYVNNETYTKYKKTLEDEIDKLQQKNEILKENKEHNDKVVDKVNWENMLLKNENKHLQDNWNKLKKYIKNEIPEDVFIDTEWFVSILDKMHELEGSDSNVKK